MLVLLMGVITKGITSATVCKAVVLKLLMEGSTKETIYFCNVWKVMVNNFLCRRAIWKITSFYFRQVM